MLSPQGRRPSAARDDLLRQASIARSLGSGFVAEVLAAAWRQLDYAPRLAQTVDTWPGDPAAAAMAMRLNAGLHALARRGTIAGLSALYAGAPAIRDAHRLDGAIAAGLSRGEDVVLEWMSHPTQTNEVARSAAFMAALMTLAAQSDMPFDLLEIGASAGLNLLLDRYAHELGGTAAGTPGSPVRIAPVWRGPPPPPAGVTIASARGVDLRPLDIAEPFTRERLLSYVWADDRPRAERLCQAITLARACPPVIDRESAAPWLRRRLAEAQPAGICRVIQHSMVLQYLPEAERRGVLAAIIQAGAQATAERPLAWIALEWNARRSEVQLRLTRWAGAGGESRVLATCHAYGAWIDWRG
ncbi:MAG TPA: DUF2332 family protein [Novosphingobium sp.]|nr:DUF2332 family protein [Novosphingobium sp.]HMP56933.1 DUF2332 family protein [Novosphingobium sp.]